MPTRRRLMILLAAALILVVASASAQAWWPWICGSSFCEGTIVIAFQGEVFCNCRPQFANGLCACTSGTATGGPCSGGGICIYSGI